MRQPIATRSLSVDGSDRILDGDAVLKAGLTTEPFAAESKDDLALCRTRSRPSSRTSSSTSSIGRSRRGRRRCVHQTKALSNPRVKEVSEGDCVWHLINMQTLAMAAAGRNSTRRHRYRSAKQHTPAGQPPILWRGRCKPLSVRGGGNVSRDWPQQQRICDGQLHRLVVFGVAAARCAKDEAGGVLGGARVRLRISQHAKRSASTTIMLRCGALEAEYDHKAHVELS